MKFNTHKLRNVAFVGGTLFLALFVWMGNRAVDEADTQSLKGYGGRLSQKVMTALERMNSDLEHAKEIVIAGPRLFLFIDGSEELKEYRFDYETLWCNDFPIISGIRAFHFEYRDDGGNLLTRPDKYLSFVESVAYTIRVSQNKKDVLTNYRAKMPHVCSGYKMQNKKRMIITAALND